ncbi:MAG: outer membrane lipoprotein carrier protein LolA [Bacteroidales bacterium]
MYIVLITLLIVCYGNMSGTQQEEKARKILEQFSEQVISAPSVSIDFTVIVSSLRDDIPEEFEGEIIISNDKYRLSFMETETRFDGKSVYTYMPEVNEVIISDPEESGGLISNPAKLFTIYNEEFSYRFIGEENHERITLYEIDLHPVELDHDFHTVKLFIRQEDHILHSAVIAGKDGNRYTLIVNDFNFTGELPGSFFLFNKSDYPGVEVIDMRW